MSDSLWSHGLQHTRLPCPSPTPGVYSNSYPSSWWCHQTISPSVIPSPLTFNISQNQGLLQWVSSSRQVAKLLELQLKHQCFQWIGLNNTYIHVSILLKLIWSNIIPLEASLNWLFKTYCMSYHVSVIPYFGMSHFGSSIILKIYALALKLSIFFQGPRFLSENGIHKLRPRS